MVPAVTFQREPFVDAWPGIRPLVAAHWKEVAYPGGHEPVADVQNYAKACAEGRLVTFTAKAKDPPLFDYIIGYAMFWIGPGPQDAGEIGAWQDAVYLMPEHREGGHGLELLRFCDAQLRDLGVHLVHHGVRPGRDFSPVLRMLGYTFVEHVYARRLNP